MADNSHRATIIVAVIGLVGTIAAALISNWDKIGVSPRPADSQPHPPAPTPTPIRAAEKAESIINIGGAWRDPVYPAIRSRITQNGNEFSFQGQGIFQNLAYQVSGTGTITGQTITTSYVSTFVSGQSTRGECSGTVTADGRKMTSTCTDVNLGTYVTSGVRD